MTQNKFWLVWNEAGNAPKKRHDTEESAYKEAHRLASMFPQHEYVVLRAVRSFKADVSVVETDLTVPEVDTTETLTPKFKVGDKVFIKGCECEYHYIIEKVYADEKYLIRNCAKEYNCVTYVVNHKEIELAE